jgi:hypothetical protein
MVCVHVLHLNGSFLYGQQGRFLLAAVSGRVLVRSFHAVLNVGIEIIKQALGSGDVTNSELTWNRMQLSLMLEHVQVHVAPTDVDPGAGLQWLALLERVFMPCDMFFRYTRHKGGTTDLKVPSFSFSLSLSQTHTTLYICSLVVQFFVFQVKPLKELAFNSQNITATKNWNWKPSHRGTKTPRFYHVLSQ